MRTRSSTVPSRALLGAALLNLLSVAVGAQDASPPVVREVSATTGSGACWFVVVLDRPADMGGLTIERAGWGWRPDDWPRFAELRAETAWRTPCYLEWPDAESDWQPAPRLDRLTFVGRCASRERLALTLRYPLEAGGIRTAPVEIDLTGAAPLEGGDADAAGRRWAAAEARWFAAMARLTGDPTSFFTFAEQQTRRRFRLVESEESRQQRQAQRRPPEEQLYDLTTGALAVQESLQLDRMTNADRDRGAREVEIASIPAVAIASHPFDRMRGERQPVHSRLARLAPHDFYYARFARVDGLLALLDFAGQWGGSLLQLAQPDAADYGTRARLQRQLCLSDATLRALARPGLVADIALVGSDPYLRAGSDLTVLLAAGSRDALKATLDAAWEECARAEPDAVCEPVEHAGVRIERLVGRDRRVSCHRAWLDDVCVIGNSPAAVRRIIDVRAGSAPSLADEPDFRFIRAVPFPLTPQEDGFVYLSDAFIRRLVGPQLRILNKRRLEAATSLKLLTNAAMYHGYVHGPGRPTFEELVSTGALDPQDLFDPQGGSFEWDASSGLARSATWGTLTFLTPLLEIDAGMATQREREQYEQFRDRYQSYWRNYFDPIGVRLSIGRDIGLETYILPLIELSEYDQFEDLAGGDPIEVDVDAFAESTLLRIVWHLREGVVKQQATAMLSLFARTNVASDWIGDWATFWVEDTDAFHALVRREFEPDPGRPTEQELIDVFNASLTAGVHCRNRLSLAAFLVALRGFVEQTAPGMVAFNSLPEYRGVSIVQIAPTSAARREFGIGGDGADRSPVAPADAGAIPPTAPGSDAPAAAPRAPSTQTTIVEQAPALYYASIEDGFYVSTQAAALRRLADRMAESRAHAGASRSERANVFLYAAPRAAERLRPTVSYLLEQRVRQASLAALGQVWVLGRCGLLEGGARLDDVARHYLGYRLACPDGGAFAFDPRTLEASSSVHGSLSDPRRLETLPEGSPFGRLLDSVETVTASLRFTEHGLATDVRIRRAADDR